MSTYFRFLTKTQAREIFRSLGTRIGPIAIILVFVISLMGVNTYKARAAGNTYYVDNTNSSCSDSNAGTSSSLPFCTISRGAAVAVAGDTVNVLHGTYAETVYPSSGTAGSPITFHASSGVTVTGSSTGFGAGFAIDTQSYVVVDGFNTYQTHDYGFYVYGSNHITLSNNHVSYAGHGNSADTEAIYLNSTTNSTITGNTVSYSTHDGIHLINGSNNNTISNNVSFANSTGSGDAVGIELNGSSYNTLSHNMTYGNEDSGINLYPTSTGTPSTYNIVVGNLSYGNGDHGIADHPGFLIFFCNQMFELRRRKASYQERLGHQR